MSASEAQESGEHALLVAGARPMQRTAYLTLDGTYRYQLGRRWGDGPTCLWVMLNPSTADSHVDDPTIRRCIGFTKSWGLDGFDVVNLYALRSPDPKALLTHPDPIGPENADTIRYYLGSAMFTVAAWGSWDGLRGKARLDVEGMAARRGCPFVCLGTTKNGAPRHPLYVKGDTPLEPWPSPSQSTRGGSDV